MSLFTTAMDKYQLGENGHIENKWANGSELSDIQEQLVQLFFQSVRTSSDGLNTLSEKFISVPFTDVDSPKNVMLGTGFPIRLCPAAPFTSDAGLLKI